MIRAFRGWLAFGSLALGLCLSAAILRPSIGPAGFLPLVASLARTAPLALAVVAGEVLCRALRLVAMTAAVGRRLPLPAAIGITLRGDFAAAVTPGNVGGDPARLACLVEAGVPCGSGALVLALEFAVDMGMLAGVVAGLTLGGRLPWMPAPAGFLRAYAGKLVLVTVLLMACATLGRFRRHFEARLAPVVRELHEAAQALGKHPLELLLGLGAGLAHCTLRFSLLPVIAVRLGVGVALRSLLAWQLLAFYGLAYTPMPGGGGAMEAGFFTFFSGLLPRGQLGLLLVAWRLFAYHAYLVAGGTAALLWASSSRKGARGGSPLVVRPGTLDPEASPEGCGSLASRP